MALIRADCFKQSMRKRLAYPYRYDPKKRALAKRYSRFKLAKSLVNGIAIPVLVLIALLLSGANLALRTGLPWHAEAALAVAALVTLLALVPFPLSYYSGHVVDKRYRLSTQTAKAWLKDHLKGLALGYLVSVPLLTLFYGLLRFTSPWWLYAAIADAALIVFFSHLWPLVVLPLFYKLTPYRDAAQKRRLLQMVRGAGVPDIRTVLVANESQRSVRPNALFSGLGSSRRIVLFDTLLSGFTPAEVETVIAHELGHYVRKDIWRFVALDIVKAFALMLILDAALRAAIGSFGIAAIWDIAGLPLLFLAFTLFELATEPLENAYSRKREAAADWFGLEAARKPEAQASTERRLADQSLGEDRPHPLLEALFHSHPAPWRREKMCKEWKKRHAR